MPCTATNSNIPSLNCCGAPTCPAWRVMRATLTGNDCEPETVAAIEATVEAWIARPWPPPPDPVGAGIGYCVNSDADGVSDNLTIGGPNSTLQNIEFYGGIDATNFVVPNCAQCVSETDYDPNGCDAQPVVFPKATRTKMQIYFPGGTVCLFDTEQVENVAFAHLPVLPRLNCRQVGAGQDGWVDVPVPAKHFRTWLDVACNCLNPAP